MAILCKGTTIRKIDYKGINIKRAYKGSTLVFTAAFFTKILVRLSSRLVNGKKNIPNAAWATWEEERVRLSNIVTQNKNAYDKAVKAAKPYEDALAARKRERDNWLASHPKPDEQRITQRWRDWDNEKTSLANTLNRKKRELSDYKAREPTKMETNPAWTTWEAGRVERLQNKVDAANHLNGLRDTWQAAVDAYNARVDEVNTAATAYNNATTAFNDAVAARDAHKAKEPSKTIQVESQAWKDWESIRYSYADDAQKADDELRIYNREVFDPALTRETELRDDYTQKKKTYNEAVAEGAPESIIGHLKTQMDEAYAAWDDYFKNTYKPISDRLGEMIKASQKADKAYDDWITANPEPAKYETVTNPEWATWEAKRKELQQKVNSTYADMNSKEAEAKRLKAAWDADEPTYAQNIHNAETDYDNYKSHYDEVSRAYDDWLTQEPDKERVSQEWKDWNSGLSAYENAVTSAQSDYDNHVRNEPTKYETNPDYTDWLNNKKLYDEAVTRAENELKPYTDAKNKTYNTWQASVKNYNNWLTKEPAKRIDVDCKYYYYDLSVSMKDKPKLPQDESKSVLNIKLKIDNPQTEADKQDAHFINVDRGPNPAYLNTSLDVHNTSKSTSTSWASMDMIYPNAEIVFTTSSGFTKTYPIDLNKDFTTDDFAFEY